MKLLPAVIAALIGLGATEPALGWGSTGHQVVGQTAYNLLAGTAARTQVDALLKKGHAPSLAAAAEWPDCVRSVKWPAWPNGKPAYKPDRFTPAVCVHFASASGKARMVAYAKRNWSNCNRPDGETRACHALYHFADIPVAKGAYDPAFPGAEPYDIVAAINACVAILKGEAVAPPFDQIKDYEALFLLAHLMGDLNQPLHVGAIYLDGSTEKTPTSQAEVDSFGTQGGNKIFVGKTKLHGMWDLVDGKIPVVQGKVSQAVIDPAALQGSPADWASDSVTLAGEALHPMDVTYQHSAGGWTMKAPAGYKSGYVAPHQISQVAKGGARLAAVLQQIWPQP